MRTEKEAKKVAASADKKRKKEEKAATEKEKAVEKKEEKEGSQKSGNKKAKAVAAAEKKEEKEGSQKRENDDRENCNGNSKSSSNSDRQFHGSKGDLRNGKFCQFFNDYKKVSDYSSVKEMVCDLCWQ